MSKQSYSHNLKPQKGYISKRLYSIAVAFLDAKGYLTQIARQPNKYARNYQVYINGEIKGGIKKTRLACKRHIYKLFIKVVNGESI